jgi:phage regulator Rha-like protein
VTTSKEGVMAKNTIIPSEKIDRAILLLRNKRVMLDADLAMIFGTTTKRLNQQVKRNINRFPSDFLFQLTDEEKDWVVTNCDHLKQLRFSPVAPYAFTEHGTIMVAMVLNTPIAAEASVAVVRAFIKLREILLQSKDLAKRLNELESKYDRQFSVVFEAIKKLMQLPLKDTKRQKIGSRRER